MRTATRNKQIMPQKRNLTGREWEKQPKLPVHGVSSCALNLIIFTSLIISASSSCVGPRNFENENDRLRAENLKLQQQVTDQKELLSLRDGELRSLREQIEDSAHAIEGAELPVLSKLSIGKFSGPIDTDGDGDDDLIRIYLQTLDQNGRMMPVAGRVSVQAVIIKENQPPAVIARHDYEPESWHQAYASNFTGTHYTLELDLTDPLPANIKEVTVKVILTEAGTGVQFNTEKPFTLTP